MTYSAEVLADSPLAWYRQGDASGSTMTDSSGNGRNGTYPVAPTLGEPSLLTTDADTCAKFDGSNDQGTVAYAAWMNVTTFTVEAWIKPETFNDDFIVDRWSSSGNRPFFFALNSSAKIRLVSSTAGADVVGATTLVANQIYHVVATVDAATTTARLYVNGVLDATDTSWSAATSTSLAMNVGGNVSFYFDGWIDEVAFYGTALSGARVAAHYTAGTSSPLSLGVATEADAALPMVLDLGLAVETDTALPLVSDLPLGVAVETDTALPVDVAHFGVAVETDMALVMEAAALPLGVAAESDTAIGFQISETNLNHSEARDRDGAGTWVWEPPIVAPPAVVGPRYDYITAVAYTGLDLASGAPQLTDLQQPERVRPPIRILVAGRDVTYWRGAATPEPTYSLISPLGYGSGSISFPQIHVPFEQPGSGALHWLKPLARVVIQRLNDTGDAVVADYWRGFLGAQDVDGGALTFQLEGEASGRLSALDRQPRVFRRRNDLGYWWHSLIRELKLPAGPKVDTGIVLQNTGGMDGPEYAAHLSAKGVGRAGNQWTVMPNADGVYVTARKDRTTIDATVYFDTDRTVAKLRRDPFEEPNRIFATAVSPGGRRIRFADYPVLQDVRALPYPMNDGSPFGEGTTDGDTDTGSGVTVMLSRLVHTGYLSQEDRPGGFDGDVTKALLELQDDAGLAQTGNMNENTWDALFDVGITGYDTGGAKIRPAVQRSATRKYNYTAAGIVRGLNPDYDPTVMPVDRTIDVGTGFTENQVKEFARQQLQESADPNWVGSVVFTPPANVGGAIGLIEGEHTPGDPVTSGMVMDARRLKPGMNIWAPLWDGGTLFHVSGVEVSGRSVRADLDTRARDTAELYEVIDRIRESRRRPGRTWMLSHRGSDINNDIVHEGDAIGGQVQPTALKGNTWNVIPVVVGQEGNITKLRLKVTANAAYADVEGPGVEYVAAVFGRKIPEARLNARIGDPLTAEGSEKWTDQGVLDDLDDNWVLLYVAGNNEQPLGYGSKRKGAPGATLSGRWEYDAGFPYYAYDDCSLWLAIYPATDSALKGQRVLWNQNEWS